MRRHFVPRVCLEPMEFQRGPSTPPKPNPANALTQLALQRKWASQAVAPSWPGDAARGGCQGRKKLARWPNYLIDTTSVRVYHGERAIRALRFCC
jgi:hypothetical protein